MNSTQTIDTKTLNLIKMARAYIGLGEVDSAKLLLDKALLVIDPEATFRPQIPNGLQDPNPVNT